MLEYLKKLISLLKLRDRMIDECDEENQLLDEMDSEWKKCDKEEQETLKNISKELSKGKLDVEELEEIQDKLHKDLSEH